MAECRFSMYDSYHVNISECGSKNGSRALREPEQVPVGAKMAPWRMLRLTLPCAQVAQACAGLLTSEKKKSSLT
jgi:hypothetical protein